MRCFYSPFCTAVC